MLLTQELRGGTSHIQLHLDSDATTTPFSSLPQLTILRGKDGQKPAAERLALNWTSADVLSAEVPLDGGQTLLASVEVPGVGHTTLPPICLPYSAEYALRHEGEGLQTLQRMARATGGIERVNLSSIWSDLPRMPRMVSLAPWLLLAAMTLVLLEVLHAAPACCHCACAGQKIGAVKQAPAVAPVPVVRGSSPIPSAAQPAPPKTTVPSQVAEPAPVPEETVVDALSQARNRAARRTQALKVADA